jgi:hypothetical protein
VIDDTPYYTVKHDVCKGPSASLTLCQGAWPMIVLMCDVLCLSSDHDNEDPEGQSLYAFIDTTKIRGMNESVTGACANPFKPWTRVSTPHT